MTVSQFKKIKLPDSPGVYFFLSSKKEIMYIGKATSLKTRVKSYFDKDIKEKRSVLIEKMVKEAKTIEWQETDSVLEALLLETNLIRTHKPRYNTFSKDDKSYNHVVITKEDFPRVLIIRAKDLAQTGEKEYKYIFGPFPSGLLFKEAMKIIRKLFKFYDKNAKFDTRMSKMRKGKLDFNTQIGLYPENVTKEEYARTIRHIKLFFQGKKKQIIKELTAEMQKLAKKERFEEANDVKKKIFALQHIQDVSLIKDESRLYRDDKTMRIEGYDIAHMGGKNMVGAMVVVERGEPNKQEYRKFTIKSVDHSNDPAALKEVLQRRFTHDEWQKPDLLVVDGNQIQKRVAEQVLRELNLVIPVVAVVKDDTHKPREIIGAKKLLELYQKEILLANGEAHRFVLSFHKQKRSKSFLNNT